MRPHIQAKIGIRYQGRVGPEIALQFIFKYGLDGLKADVLRQVLERAAKAAGITCSRAGANPPWKEELDLAL